MTRRACPGSAEGHRCALDAQVRQWQTHARRQAGDRHRHPELWLQEQCVDLPKLRLHPQMQGHRCGALRRENAARCRHQRQHGLRRLGRYRLPQPGQRSMAQAAEPSTAGSHAASRCPSGPPKPTPQSPRSAPASNTSSPGRRTRWGCSSAPSASNAPRPRSRWPTSPAICTA
jgi:hypothetical protein